MALIAIFICSLKPEVHSLRLAERTPFNYIFHFSSYIGSFFNIYGCCPFLFGGDRMDYEIGFQG
jgi:hypothetical protein